MAASLGLLRRVPGLLQRPARSRFMSVFTPTELISQYSAKQPRGVRLKDMFEKGRQCSPAVLLQEARFLHSGGPTACALGSAAVPYLIACTTGRAQNCLCASHGA